MVRIDKVKKTSLSVNWVFAFIPIFIIAMIFDTEIYGLTASEFAFKYGDEIPDDGKQVKILVKVKGDAQSLDPDKRAKEIRYLQSGVLKFVSFAGGVNVLSDPWNNEFTATVHPKVAELVEQRSDVISVLILEQVSPTHQIFYGKFRTSIECREGFVTITKYNGSLACVKPTSVYPLLQRGWASHENTDTATISLNVALWFVKSSPTFTFDGINETLNLEIVAVRESYPEQYEIEASFSSRHGGYGDRTDMMVTQVITPHVLKMVVSSGNVVSAIMDEEWDELHQKLWKIHDLPDTDTTVTQNSDVIQSGQHKVNSGEIIYDGTSGFIAQPSDEGTFPGVVMIHEWWGLNENIKETAKNLASNGYVVLAVDLFGDVATTSEHARQLVTSFDQEKGILNMNSAADFLIDNYQVDKIGSIGWCFGGAQSLKLALNNQEMDATVIYYGNLVSDKSQLSTIQWPVLGIFAELDQGITVDSVNEFEASLNELEIQNEIYIYSGVDHAFANPTGERYAPEETEDAWKKTLEFLENNLK